MASRDQLRAGILSTAQALGISPIDLATAISYETAGTFDPTKRGPTTKWGQHRGLIQFGEPQARQYGVDWNDPMGSQLGPKGAVANYLRDTGVQPGMGLLDVYSAINAGGVGKYNASDAAAGGAPGTVRDKVEQQMAGHRAKAEALFGGPSPSSPAGGARAASEIQPPMPDPLMASPEFARPGAGGIPDFVGRAAADDDEPSMIGRMGKALQAIGNASPAAPPVRFGQIPDARQFGGLLSQTLNSPTIAQGLLQKRFSHGR